MKGEKGLTGGEESRIDAAVMARLRAPFGCEYIAGRPIDKVTDAPARWRIHDANDDAIASCAGREEGYARLIVDALNAWQRSQSRAAYDAAVARASERAEMLLAVGQLDELVALLQTTGHGGFLDAVSVAFLGNLARALRGHFTGEGPRRCSQGQGRCAEPVAFAIEWPGMHRFYVCAPHLAGVKAAAEQLGIDPVVRSVREG